MAPDLDIVRSLVRAHEQGTLIIPLPQVIYSLRQFITANKAREAQVAEKLRQSSGNFRELEEELEILLTDIHRQQVHLLECEQALKVVLSRLQGEKGTRRCPVCHHAQTTRGGVLELHNAGVFRQAEGLVESPMCSGSGRKP